MLLSALQAHFHALLNLFYRGGTTCLPVFPANPGRRPSDDSQFVVTHETSCREKQEDDAKNDERSRHTWEIRNNSHNQPLFYLFPGTVCANSDPSSSTKP